MDHSQIWHTGSIVEKLLYADIVAMETQQPWQQTVINFICLFYVQLRQKLVCGLK